MDAAAPIAVVVRRRWNDPRSARVPLAALRELELCVIERDNSAAVNTEVRALMRKAR